jgi:hypothetical protein
MAFEDQLQPLVEVALRDRVNVRSAEETASESNRKVRKLLAEGADIIVTGRPTGAVSGDTVAPTTHVLVEQPCIITEVRFDEEHRSDGFRIRLPNGKEFECPIDDRVQVMAAEPVAAAA